MRTSVGARLLLAFLVGVVAVPLLPFSAQAADEVGPVQSVFSDKVTFDTDFGFTPGGCDVQAWWIGHRLPGAVTATYTLRVRSDCLAQLNAWAREDGTLSIKDGSKVGAGGDCTLTGPLVKELDGKLGMKFRESAYLVAGTAPADAPNGPGGSVCAPGLLHAHYPGNGFDWQKTVSMPPLPAFTIPRESDCTYGTPLRAVMGDYDYDERAGTEANPNALMRAYIAGQFSELQTEGWIARHVYATTSTLTGTFNSAIGRLGTTSTLQTSSGMMGIQTGEEPVNSTFGFPEVWRKQVPDGWLRIANIDPGLELVGVQFLNTNVPGNASTIARSLGPGVSSGGTWDSRIGTTDATRCAFWLGPKIWTDGAEGGADEPWTDVSDDPATGAPDDPEDDPRPGSPDEGKAPAPDPDPPQEASQCEFSLTDPGSWLNGGMCALVGLMKRVVSRLWDVVLAIGRLPAQIAEALLGAVADAVVPDKAMTSASMARIRASWAASSVGDFFTDSAVVLGAFQVPAGGSCKGPGMTVPLMESELTVHPVDACDGTGATIAALVKAWLYVSVGLGTAWTCVRIVGAAVGLNLNGVGAGS